MDKLFQFTMAVILHGKSKHTANPSFYGGRRARPDSRAPSCGIHGGTSLRAGNRLRAVCAFRRRGGRGNALPGSVEHDSGMRRGVSAAQRGSGPGSLPGRPAGCGGDPLDLKRSGAAAVTPRFRTCCRSSAGACDRNIRVVRQRLRRGDDRHVCGGSHAGGSGGLFLQQNGFRMGIRP